MTRSLASLLCGIVFGLGLSISGMINPAKVQGFLDFAGQWDPTLAFVMAGAVCVYGVGFWLSQRRNAPVFAAQFRVPDRRDIDKNLLAGAAIFGMGWGLAGFCPGPALTGLAFGLPKTYIFVAAMIAGVLIYNYTMGARAKPAPA